MGRGCPWEVGARGNAGFDCNQYFGQDIKGKLLSV